MDTADAVDSSQVSLLADRIRERLGARRTISSTYRLQFHSDFTFRDAAPLADYFADLGVSHVYSSPQSVARAGSRHGYDVVDPQRLNPELGTPEEAEAYRQALVGHGLGQVVDIVPNHMCVATSENAWWMDVLTHGPASRFAFYFDIDWQPLREELAAGVLLPILGDLYGRTLEAGQLVLRFMDGAFWLDCPGTRLPLDPKTWITVLEQAWPPSGGNATDPAPDELEFRSILSALSHLPERTASTEEARAERFRETIVIQGRLKRLCEAVPDLTARIEQTVKEINGRPGEPATFDRLHQLLEAQVYHLVHWKAGSDELNYRRFFDVTELAAICTERLDVYEASHRKWITAAAAGQIDGLRIDHIDGLFDPAAYLWRLQLSYLRELVRTELRGNAAAGEPSAVLSGNGESEGASTDLENAVLDNLAREFIPAHRRNVLSRDDRAADGSGLNSLSRDGTHDESAIVHTENGVAAPPRTPVETPLPVYVEKILGREETLPTAWPVLGTTGYEFLSQVNGLFVSPEGLAAIRRYHGRTVKDMTPVTEVMHRSKRLILSGPLQSEIQLLAHRLDRLSGHHRSTRDYTLLALRNVLREVIACFPVYRTYIAAGDIAQSDRQIVGRAIAEARRRNPLLDQELFAFLRDVLFLERPPLDSAGERERALFVGRFQQVTGPVAAKGVEDTTFYRYIPLTSLSEVGVELPRPLMSVSEFHQKTLERQRRWPDNMLATTTHDTKRTEDVRTRLSVLSEIPGEWNAAVGRWFRWNRKFRREVDGGPAPSANDEWLFYQSLVGIWPLETPSGDDWKDLTQRLLDYMQKGTHEAKLQTSWIHPNAAYDEAVADFVRKVMEDREGRFLTDVAAFADSVTNFGLFNSCSQVLLRVMSPGTPDLYQGQELWDFSLVDPDNRRPVDYERRRKLLGELRAAERAPGGRLALAKELAGRPRDPRLKLHITTTALHYRRGFTGRDSYEPIEAIGPRADHVCAFRRVSAESGRTAIVVAPRFFATLAAASGKSSPWGPAWAETAIDLPSESGHFTNALTGENLAVRNGHAPLAEVLRDFPVAFLISDPR